MTVESTTDVAAPELAVATDMARKSVVVAAVLILASGLIWGIDGALSSAYSVVLVVLNFLAAAALIGWGARRGTSFLMGAVLGGFPPPVRGLPPPVLPLKD